MGLCAKCLKRYKGNGGTLLVSKMCVSCRDQIIKEITEKEK